MPLPGDYRDGFTLRAVPAGQYRLEWVEPASGRVMRTQTIDWRGGDLGAKTPAYALDVALRMKRTAR